MKRTAEKSLISSRFSRILKALRQMRSWGSRGRRFDSCHSDHVAASFISLAATFLQKSPARSFRCVAFSAKSHAGSSYALVNAGITPPLRYNILRVRLRCMGVFSSPIIPPKFFIWQSVVMNTRTRPAAGNSSRIAGCFCSVKPLARRVVQESLRR